MKAKELHRRLSRLIKKYGDADVMFDTNAVCFDVHLVNVAGVHPVPKEMLDRHRDIVVLDWDMPSEPYHFQLPKKTKRKK